MSAAKLGVAWALLVALSLQAEDSVLTQAERAMTAGKPDEAATMLTQALEKDPKNTELLSWRAKAYDLSHEHAKAAVDLVKFVELSGNFHALRGLGAQHFFAGNFDASVAAFDEYAKHFPDSAPQLWERGISLYYAKRYDDGRKQFETHKKVNPHDVENAAWHFLCAAKATSVEAARKNLIFIDTDKDTRVPMKQVYQLFKGEAKPEDVLAAAKAGEPDAETLKNNLCFAHLYLGLYYEASGDAAKAREHIEKAAVEFKHDHYMGRMAQVHFGQLKAR